MTESDTTAALRRAGRKAGYHLLRAALEAVKALEAFVDELASMGDDPDDEGPGGRVRIDVE